MADTNTSRIRIPRSVGFAATSASLIAFFLAAGAPTPLLPLYEASWGFAPSMLTLAFGVYAIAMVAALLVVGSLSDHIGRRPLLIGSLALELVAVLVFFGAQSIGWLIVARILQGIATGAASSSFGAAAVELASENRKKLGALMTSLASTAGLGVGALFAGLVALAIPASAAVIVWAALAVVMAAGTVFALLTPETSTRRPGALASLAPRFTIPAKVRPLFVATAPSIVATFLTATFFLGLLPTVLGAVFGITSPIVGGVLTFVMFGVAATASVTTSAIPAHLLKILGDAAIVVGAIGLLAAFASGDLALVWGSTVFAGAGLGGTFSASTRSLVPEVAAHERAGLFAGIFVIAYVTLGVAAIAAGFVATAVGVEAVAIGFTAVLAILGLVGMLLAVGVHTRARRTTVRSAHTPCPTAPVATR
ncbi:MFS transporter [Frondihabitans australicus]|uniref:Putative MFS family arabinose efflux permease n=1 Tax=Frondihabitans australicus TaxID=386892 RepID=A0A495IKL1_9MICO|nr:MFS transporter [Frondihabitans australicus]RKR76507.1 putative MFS family arabinose efflux permease [Frondihabitans australicus]